MSEQSKRRVEGGGEGDRKHLKSPAVCLFSHLFSVYFVFIFIFVNSCEYHRNTTEKVGGWMIFF